MSGALLAGLGLALAGAGWASWWRRIQRVDVPLRPWGHWAVMGAAVALGVAAFAAGPGWAGGLAAVLALAAGGVFLVLTNLSRIPPTPAAVALGSPAPDFTALDAQGQPFRLASLRGQPVLLKFFRGHW